MMEIKGSRRKVSIELDSPNIERVPRYGLVERLVSPGHVCNYCHGQGEVTGEDPELPGEWVFKKCPVCGGSGELDAVVTIEWRPQGNEE